jgi:predicted nucleotide-binding protein
MIWAGIAFGENTSKRTYFLSVQPFHNSYCKYDRLEIELQYGINFHGGFVEYLEEYLASNSGDSTSINKNVFVVYGHDQSSRDQLELLLRRFNLNPIILDQLPSGGQTIIEKLEANIGRARFGIVLATAEDEGHRKGHPEEKMFRARQNVILELGMLLTRLGRERVFILLQDKNNLERPSDIQGLIYIPFKDDLVREVGPLLARELEKLEIMIPASALT